MENTSEKAINGRIDFMLAQPIADKSFNSVVVIDDNLVRSKIWIKKLEADFIDIRHFYTIQAAIAEFEITSIPATPTLWMLDEYFYNQPLSKKDVKQLLQHKGERDIFISISRRSRRCSYFDFIVGDEPRSWEALRKEIGV